MEKTNMNFRKKGLIGVISLAIILIGGFTMYQQLYKTASPTEPTEATSPATAFSHLSYYHEGNLERYNAYQEENQEMSVEDIVTHVNMGIDKEFYSEDPITVEDPDALTVLVNKVYAFPDNWEPTDLVVVDDFRGQSLRKEAAEAFQAFNAACNEQGFSIYVHSGYRSASFQQEIYDNMINTYGEEYTDKYISRPHQSEHQTGLSVDVSIDGMDYNDLASNPYYSWFYDHLADFGFILRYPENKEALTGYHYESWHIRYIGKEESRKVLDSGLTYDEYMARQ